MINDREAAERPRKQRDSGPSWGSYLRNTALIAALVVMLWLVFNVKLPSLRELQAWIEGYGWGGWLAFVVLYAVVSLTPIPVTIMAVTGGLLFGVVLGSTFSVVGALLGSWGAYWLARLLGATAVRRLLGEHGRKVEDNLAGAGFQAVCTLRLMPGVPYWPVNYGSGAFGVTQRDFLLASVISVIPGQVSLVALGAFVTDVSWFHGTVVVVSWVVVVVMTVWAYRQWRSASRRLRGPSGAG